MPFDHNVLLHVRVGDDGEADIQQQVLKVDIEDVDRGSDKATIILDNQAGANEVALRRGMQVRIDMGWESEYAFLFHGRIHAAPSRADSGSTGRLQLVCFDLSKALNAVPPQPGRQHVGSLADILTALADEVSIPIGGVAIDPMPSWTEDRPLNQGTRTAWGLIQNLAEEYRARAFVEVNGDPGDEDQAAGGEAKLYFMSETALLAAPPLGKLVMCHGFDQLIEFEVRNIGSGAAPVAAITVADPETGAPVTEAAPEPAADPPAAVADRQSAELEGALGGVRAADADAAAELANAATQQPAESLARAQIAGAASDPERSRRLIQRDQTRALGLFGQGLTNGTIFLRAKGSVEIDGVTSAGRWYLRRVNHIVERTRVGEQVRSTYRTRFEATR